MINPKPVKLGFFSNNPGLIQKTLKPNEIHQVGLFFKNAFFSTLFDTRFTSTIITTSPLQRIYSTSNPPEDCFRHVNQFGT